MLPPEDFEPADVDVDTDVADATPTGPDAIPDVREDEIDPEAETAAGTEPE